MIGFGHNVYADSISGVYSPCQIPYQTEAQLKRIIVFKPKFLEAGYKKYSIIKFHVFSSVCTWVYFYF